MIQDSDCSDPALEVRTLTEGDDVYNPPSIGGDDCKLLVVYGLGGDDRLYSASSQPETFFGGEGNDVVRGQVGIDLIFGDEGDDRLFGGYHDDLVDGGVGDDWLAGNTGNDVLRGGLGQDYLEGGKGDDELRGNGGADVLLGGRRDDELQGGSGNDILRGQAGRDVLDGGLGDDLLIGNVGNDTFTGGDGEDVFRFDKSFGNDLVTDFWLGEDILRVAGVDYADPETSGFDVELVPRADSVLGDPPLDLVITVDTEGAFGTITLLGFAPNDGLTPFCGTPFPDDCVIASG